MYCNAPTPNPAQSIARGCTPATGSDVVVSVKNLGKCYRIYESPRDKLKEVFLFGRRTLHREFWALRDISFDVKKGETLGIIGRNGSGKSTLLQILCGTITPNTGEVAIRGRVAALLELGSGFNMDFTGRENIHMNAAILGLTREEIEKKYDQIVSFAELENFIDQPVKTYSTGMLMRLGFAIAAHVDADILVIDEALAVGDAFFVQKCMRFLRKFRRQGTLIFVSHDSAAVTNLCNRVILLESGTMKANGPAKDVCNLYLESLFSARQDTDRAKKIASTPRHNEPRNTGSVDQRLKYINQSQLRNDLEIFTFREDGSCFGKGDVSITNVRLLDAQTGAPLKWVVGGEQIVLAVRCEAHEQVDKPIIGFYIRDRLGQNLFGDNTYLTYRDDPFVFCAGGCYEARFSFRMPVLPVGDYMITAAIADGTQAEHTQHHWMHDALLFRSHSSSASTGLVGIPMESISFEEIKDDET